MYWEAKQRYDEVNAMTRYREAEADAEAAMPVYKQLIHTSIRVAP